MSKRTKQHEMLIRANQDRGPLSLDDLSELWDVKQPQRILWEFKRKGWSIPKMIDKRVRGYCKPKKKKKTEVRIAAHDPCEPLNLDGCVRLAWGIIKDSLLSIKAGRDIEYHINYLLHSNLSMMAWSMVSMEAQEAIDLMLEDAT